MSDLYYFNESLSSKNLSFQSIKELDFQDPLADQAKKFDLPEGLIYLDGNSLGAMPKGVPDYFDKEIRDGWRTGLIRSWNGKGWHNMPLTLGNRLAP